MIHHCTTYTVDNLREYSVYFTCIPYTPTLIWLNILYSYSFNTRVAIQILNEIRAGDTTRYAQKPHLFARLPLENRFSLDTNSGQLILKQVKRVWLRAAPGIKPRDTSTIYPSTSVFENLVVNKEDDEFRDADESMHSAEHIYLALSGPIVKQYGLETGQTIQVDLQFQIDRQMFNEWHYALDELKSPELISPDICTFIQPNMDLMKNIRELTAKTLNFEYVFYKILLYFI